MTERARPLRVLLVCQWYAPEPVTQPGWIVDGLRRAGADVRVLTGMPNYPAGVRHAGYPRFRTRNDEVDGVAVRRTPLFASHGRGAIPRFLNYLTWALTSSLGGRREILGADVVLVYSSPATAALGPWWWNRRRGVPYVLQIQDLWPDSVTASGMMPHRFARLVGAILDLAIRRFNARAASVVVISPGMADVLTARGVHRERISLVYNWAPEFEAEPSVDAGATTLRQRLGLDADAFVFMYAGNHGEAQGLEVLIHAVAAAAERDPSRDLHLVLVGQGVAKPSLEQLAERVTPRSVHFLDSMPVEALRPLMQEAQVHVVSLVDDDLFAVTMPSKVQGILAAGKPLLVCGRGDVANVVLEASAGAVAPPGDASAAAEQMLKLTEAPVSALDDMGRNGRRYYEERMSEQIGGRTLVRVLEAASREGAR